MRVTLLVCLAVVACEAKVAQLTWREQKLTKVEIGAFTFAIPEGWRDLSESANPRVAHMTDRLVDADTEAHIVVRANDTNTDTNISFMYTNLVGLPTCDQWVAAMESLSKSPSIDHATVVAEQWGADKGCSFEMTDATSRSRNYVRFRGDKFLTVQCLRPTQVDANADATCDSVVAALRAM